ncbi:U-box domain-containing protein 43 [Acorus calamus]|uniref:RING-type E3 ubiquitin transferase n=1 Tax=Acorus calamus TaxID=4465 RepID=A0AAV9D562_ACOCL|nr:U-box domain-containing protein 43 [Acorus calamus]
MSFVELIPIGTFLALLTEEVIETANAAKDVLIEKESFKELSRYLYHIEPVLKELQLRELSDSNAARQALEFLETDIKKAKNLVEKYKNRARFYLLVWCRHIVKEVQDVTRDIGRSLAALSLASTEVLSHISDKVNQLHGEMQRAHFEASHAQIRIVEKLNQGLREQKRDQRFANDMLEDIARAVGVPIEPSEISRELEFFRKEKEEAAARKERAEEHFIEQVIELLSRADAANDQEGVRKQYLCRVETVHGTEAEYIAPLKAFTCPLGGNVMVDPVSLCTGTTFERGAIEAWFDSGKNTDPDTGQALHDLMLRPNIRLRQSIEEWQEINYCLVIRSSKQRLQSGTEPEVVTALDLLQDIVKENPINKDWIAIEGLIDIILSILRRSRNRYVKRRVLNTLMTIVEGHSRNKDLVVECREFDQIIYCLGRGPDESRAAVELLWELFQGSSGWKEFISQKLVRHDSTVIFLVVLLNSAEVESARRAEAILLKLCDDCDDNIIKVASANWYEPLLRRLREGPDSSRISMARALVKMELVDQNIKHLSEGGAIRSLVEMASGNLEAKEVALCALVKLSNFRENKRQLAEAGAVPLILELMFSPHIPTIIITRCSEILERLLSNDGTEFLVEANGTSLELEPIITNLLALQQNLSFSPTIRKPALRALLSICKSEATFVQRTVVAADGVPIILPLLDDPDKVIRKLAINVLFYFSQHEPQGIVDFLLSQRRLESFIGFLKDDSGGDLPMAAAGLLAHLPKSEVRLTEELVKLDGLSAIMNILSSGTIEAKENALGAMFRFTDPSDLTMQRSVVGMGLYPLLISFLKTGSSTSKARAAALICNLSLNSPKLTVMKKQSSWWCFGSPRIPICDAHGGICDVSTTFCMLKANALPELVNLVKEHVNDPAYEALRAMSTLFQDGFSYRGAEVLNAAEAISPVLHVLEWGTSAMKEEALNILEKAFEFREVADMYCTSARILLIALSTQSHQDRRLGRKAAAVLAQLERYYSKSMPLV